MRRGRLVVAVFVGLCLALPPVGHEASAADTVVECGFGGDVVTNGVDGSTTVATYRLSATWCVETTYETRTFTEGPSSDDQQVEKATKASKKKSGRQGKRARKRAKRAKEPSSPSAPRTRTERRVVSECITDLQIEADPQTLVTGAELIGVTTTQVPAGDPCSSRSYRVVGRFGRDYVAGVPGVERSVISQTVAGVTLENYPFGRFGQFDITATFSRVGGATCNGCVPEFAFCDVRIAYDDDEDGCLRL